MSTVSTSGTVHSARAVAPIIGHSWRRVATHLRFRVTGRWTALILNANSQNAPDLHVQRESSVINHHLGFHAIKVSLFCKFAAIKLFFLFPAEINSRKNMRYLFSLKYFSIYDEATRNYKRIIVSFSASFLCLLLVHRYRLLNLSANNLNPLHRLQNPLHCLHVCTYETVCRYIYQLPPYELSRVQLQCFMFKYCH